MKKLIVLFFILFIVIYAKPVLGAETVTKDNFAEPIIKVNDKTYIPNETAKTFNPGDNVEIYYKIEPKTDEDAKKIDDRYYYIRTSLEDADVSIDLRYKNGAATLDIEDFSLHIPDADSLEGVASIEIELTGSIPSITSRLEEKAILWIDVQDAEDRVLPPVTVIIVNPTKFLEDINALKNRISQIRSEVERLDEMGANTIELNRYIKMASNNISKAEDYYNDREYVKSNKSLKSAENYLNKAELGLNKTEALFLYDQIEGKLDDLKIAIVKLEYLIQQAENEGKTVVTYEIELAEIKSKYEDILSRSDKVKDYIELEEYYEAKNLANRVLSTLEPLNTKVNDMISELKSEALSKPTETPTSEGFSFKLDTKMLTYIGIGVAVIVCGGIAAVAISRWRQRRKWDELR